MSKKPENEPTRVICQDVLEFISALRADECKLVKSRITESPPIRYFADPPRAFYIVFHARAKAEKVERDIYYIVLLDEKREEGENRAIDELDVLIRPADAKAAADAHTRRIVGILADAGIKVTQGD